MKKLPLVLLLLLSTWASAQDALYGPHDSLIRVGIQYVQNGDLDAAKDVAYAAMERYPEGAPAYYLIGYCYSMDCREAGENCELAISFLDRSIDIDRDYRYPFYNRALCKHLLGDLDGALADINIQIEQDDQDPTYFFLRAQLYYKLGNRAGTCTDLSHLRRSDSGDLDEADLLELQRFCEDKNN
ncbi:MAG: hypothetical protein AAFW73_24635 [Bacteroidota bacterium]